MHEEIPYVLALKLTPGIGDVLAKQLISYCGSPQAVFNLPKGKLLKVPGVGQKAADNLLSKAGLKPAESIANACVKSGVEAIPYFDPAYPSKLKLVNDAPLLVYHQGQENYNERKVIGIVGTRNATDYGRRVTQKIVEELKVFDPIIVSGLAYGIDICAHKSALKEGLSTVGVLAGGLDMIYPAVHKSVAKDMLEIGGLFSEHPPGTKPDAHHFPARNRIIAGMCDAVIVVEAAKKGGALITAHIAYSYNREVFAVPGELGSKYSEGCNALLRSQRALIYTDIEDIAYNLNWKPGEKSESPQPTLQLNMFGTDEQKVIQVLSEFKKGLHLDELCWKCQMSVNQVVALLLNMEFSGLVESLPGKQYRLLKAF